MVKKNRWVECLLIVLLFGLYVKIDYLYMKDTGNVSIQNITQYFMVKCIPFNGYQAQPKEAFSYRPVLDILGYQFPALCYRDTCIDKNVLDKPQVEAIEAWNQNAEWNQEYFRQMEEENHIARKEDQVRKANAVTEQTRGLDKIHTVGASGDNQLFTLLKNEEKKQNFWRSDLKNMQKLKKQFYTVDATTDILPERLNLNKLLDTDMHIEKGDGPQILIYHTHSQEAFADSVPGDTSTSIVGVGEFLTNILTEQYGYHVLHHCGEYDVESRDYAYAKAAPALEEILAQYPTIQVVIDLHRDAAPEGTRLVTNINGVDVAQFMFFNGLSYTNEQGDIPYLYNPYLQDNLAFSFQMKLAAESYYPGLTRKIYLKGYRYNMHYCPKSLLIELGAQTNTVQEVMNACIPLAHTLDIVLSGHTPELPE